MPLLNVKQVAERLNVAASTVYMLVAEGRLSCFRIGKGRGAVRFSEEQITSFLDSARQDCLSFGEDFPHLR
jgi:excisionase family DNA binding protein